MFFLRRSSPCFRTLKGKIGLIWHWFSFVSVVLSAAECDFVGSSIPQCRRHNVPITGNLPPLKMKIGMNMISSRCKLQCSQYDFPSEKEWWKIPAILCPSSVFPLELLHLQDKPCGQTVTYLISVTSIILDHDSDERSNVLMVMVVIKMHGAMIMAMLIYPLEETGQRFVVQYRLCVAPP